MKRIVSIITFITFIVATLTVTANKLYAPEKLALEKGDKNEMTKASKTYAEKLDIEPDEKYHVDWDMTVSRITKDDAPMADMFWKLLKKEGIEDRFEGYLLAITSDESGKLYKCLSSAIKNIPLADGYKWFCERNYDNVLAVGIMETTKSFTTKAHEASVDYESVIDKFIMPWTFDTKGTSDYAWARFVEANSGEPFAVEINGICVLAPMILFRNTEGSCSTAQVSPEVINHLFKGARKYVEDNK